MNLSKEKKVLIQEGMCEGYEVGDHMLADMPREPLRPCGNQKAQDRSIRTPDKSLHALWRRSKQSFH